MEIHLPQRREVFRWETRTCRVQPGVGNDQTRLDILLKDFWEPFAVTWGDGCFVYHLRRLTPVVDGG